jgi:hypothetical protein
MLCVLNIHLKKISEILKLILTTSGLCLCLLDVPYSCRGKTAMLNILILVESWIQALFAIVMPIAIGYYKKIVIEILTSHLILS